MRFFTEIFKMFIERVGKNRYQEFSQALKRNTKKVKKLGVKIGREVLIDRGFECLSANLLQIDDYTAIGKNFRCYNYDQIFIGKFCMFAGEVQINNGSHRITDFLPYSGKIEIQNGVWVGHGARIIGTNLVIGENSIIGAGSLLLESVEPNSIMAGVPAKKIGIRTPASKIWHYGDIYFSPITFTKEG